MTGAPKTIGRYEIRRELGRGMMGVVYEAVDTVLHRTIALKTIGVAYAPTADEREAYERRFLTEARAAAGLTHPNIVVVHDVGRDVDTGTLFMAMEYLHGQTLAELLAGGEALEWRKALRIIVPLAAALHVAHGRGIIHRDIKPANIMLLPHGEPKIMDFGIAKVQACELTAAGQVFGTPSFMSPEQALGEPLDPRTDLFSLGTVMYQLLTGRKAFPGENLPQILALVIRKDPPPPSHVVPSIPPRVDYVTARALAKAPNDRYPHARALAEDIEDVLAGLPPRHLGSKTFPIQAEGTLAAALPLAPASPAPSPSMGSTQGELEQALDQLAASAKSTTAPLRENGAAITATSSAPPRARRASAGEPRLVPTGVVLGLGTALGAAAAVLIVWWHGHRTGPVIPLAPVPPPTESAGRAAAPASPPGTPLRSAPPEHVPTATPSVPPPAPGKEPARGGAPTPKMVTPAPSGRPKTPVSLAPASPTPTTSPSAAPTATTQLRIDFEHPLKTGNLRVWLDGTLVLDEDLEGHVTKEVAGLRIHKGKINSTIPVSPGRHEVRVRVAWEDNVKTEVLAGNFKQGSARQLEVRLGRILKNLSLEWK